MNKYFTHISIGAVLLLSSFTSCSLDIPPQDQFSDPDAINNVKNARSLLASAYILYPHYEYELSILGNDFCPTSLSIKDVSTLNLYNWFDKDISQLAPQVWLSYYNTIASCDALIERLPQVNAGTQEEITKKKAIEAEVKTLKALCYFQLLRLFAPAYDVDKNADGIIIKNFLGLEANKRSSIQECVNYIHGLLESAVSVESDPKENGWLSQTAAQYLLAELSLYSSDYTSAAGYAEKVLSRADKSMFTSAGEEQLWKPSNSSARIFASNIIGTFYNSIQYSATEGDYFGVNPAINFTKNDNRKKFSIYPFVMEKEERRLFGKYNKMLKEGVSVAYINVFRYAGAYFIAAEAYAKMGNNGKSREIINHYLELVGAPSISSTLSNKELIDAILTEKYKEFVGEGTNFFDLKRTHSTPLKRFSTWGIDIKTVISTNDYRWTFPIPQSEYRFNKNVTQNNGWPINK